MKDHIKNTSETWASTTTVTTNNNSKYYICASMNYGELFIPTKILYNKNATICFWPDGTKTITRTKHGDVFSEEIGVAMCTMKKIYGSYFNFLNKVSKGKVQPTKENF